MTPGQANERGMNHSVYSLSIQSTLICGRDADTAHVAPAELIDVRAEGPDCLSDAAAVSVSVSVGASLCLFLCLRWCLSFMLSGLSTASVRQDLEWITGRRRPLSQPEVPS